MLEVIWPFMGQTEFLWMIVTLVLTIRPGALLAPAKAPADKNMAANAADSVIVFRVFVMVLSRWDHALNLRAD
jgi:hypothetical protein